MLAGISEDVGRFDYVVVGAGSAGCVVAARLAESGRCSVLLLEAGGRDRSPWIHIPMGYPKTFLNPRVNWMLESEPEPALNGRRLYQPGGKVLGGTSSINGMIYIRGNHADYDEWCKLGCVGWDWESVLPYFRKAEDQERGADAFHGSGGPLRVSDLPEEWPLADAMLQAAVEAGIPKNSDFNGASQDGCGYYQSTTRNRRRASSAVAYLRPARRRRNLTIEAGAHATRILIKDGRAQGVEFRSRGGSRVVRATREIIVCSGVYGSPKLLQLSGLGPAELLGRMGVSVVRDTPAVGADLQDHFSTTCVYRTTAPGTANELALSLRRRVIAALRYALFRSGPLSNNALCAGAFLRSEAGLDRPDLQINMSAFAAVERTRTSIRPYPFPAFTLSPVHLRPRGRGSVYIVSPDAFVSPSIRFNFLQDERDMKVMIAGLRMCRAIAAQPALRRHVVAEITPGPAVDTDAGLAADIRQRGISNMHPVGTCRMGADSASVVDIRLRVRGVEGLRVADASIMPTIVAGNTNAPTIMIGEKAADMIQEDARRAA